ncbi:AAA family ATPase [Antarcticirhabdus aurantiaca]|uniref:AAA family ATPase n=1 Tax=Antarcticirhabdus aurantiaca TaxID=2606717 RepID=A0ACD4NIJ3_9HYPH|nr:AAA family ATPase [Antarcticirhabdus aurantiaca]WAJ26664.1 AAA family ATPase [Jeongeuplla avenae]
MIADDDADRTIGKEERTRLGARHPIHELARCGRASFEVYLKEARENLVDEHTRMLVDSVLGAMEAGQDHLVDMPLAELVRDADEHLSWTMLFHLAGAGYRPAQLEVSTRCAAEVHQMMARHDAFRGRALDEEERRLAAQALTDAETMVGHAVGWGALAHGMVSEGRSGTVRAATDPKAIGIDATAALWAAASTSARELGRQEGFEEGNGLAEAVAKRHFKDTRSTEEPDLGQDSSGRVVVPSAALSRDDRKQWGIEGIVGKALPLIHANTLADVRRNLLAAHPHAAFAIDRILGDLVEDRPVAIRPTILVGPPGAGKSRLCRDLLDALGVPFAAIDAGTTSDHGLTGSPRRWSSAYPSVPLRLFTQHRIANPGILIDELEKAGRSSAGSVHDPLLSLLEPLSSTKWRDLFLDAEIDASRIIWLFTANSTQGLPGPLRSRLRVLKVPRPRAEHVPALADRIRRDLLAELDLEPGMEPPFDGEELGALTDAFGAEGSLRDLRRYVEELVKLRWLEGHHH